MFRFLPKTVIAIGFVSLLADISSEMIYPLLPIFLVSVLGATPTIFGIIDGAAEMTSALLKWFSGWKTDQMQKRKSLILIGYTISALMRPLIGIAQSWPMVFIFRLTDRVGKGLRSSPRDALISDWTDEKDRGKAYGLHRAMDHAGAVIGPLVASALLMIPGMDMKQVFLYAAIPGFLSVLVVVFFVKETEEKSSATKNATTDKIPNPFSDYKKMNKNFKQVLWIYVLFALSQSSDAFLLLKLKESGINDYLVPVLWSIQHIVKMLSSYWFGSISDRKGYRTMILSGWMLYSFVYFALSFVTSADGVIALFLFYGLFFGFVEGPEKAWISNIVSKQYVGSAFGLYHMLTGFALLPASFIFGYIWTNLSSSYAFLFSGSLAVLSMLLLWYTTNNWSDKDLGRNNKTELNLQSLPRTDT